MEGINARSPQPIGWQSSKSDIGSYSNPKLRLDALVLRDHASYGADRIKMGRADSGKAIGLSARKIVEKLNELIAPQAQKHGWQSTPEVPSPDEAAERIVSHVAALYHAFRNQNPNIGDEEKLERFMKAVRSGVEKGYSDAVKILDGFGAFSFEGVHDRVQLTKSLIDEKINAFESQKREELGLADITAQDTAAVVRSTVLEQG